jgi:hypothetical protein
MPCSRRAATSWPGHGRVVDAFASSGGEALALPSGEFVDVPVAERARRMLELADTLEPQPS